MEKRYRNMVLIGALLGCVASTSVLAGGVEYAHIESDLSIVHSGHSNTIYVHSTYDAAVGDYVYTDIETASDQDGMVTFGIKVEAKCTSLYRLDGAWVANGTEYEEGNLFFDPSIIVFDSAAYSQQIEVNTKNMTMPWRHVDYRIPLNNVAHELFAPPDDDSLINRDEYFFADGDDYIAQQVAQGQDEEDVRLAGFSKIYQMPMKFQLYCNKVLSLNEAYGGDTTLVPLTVYFLPPDELAPPPPIELPDLGEANHIQVTEVDLLTLQDEQTCSVDLSIMFTTNGATNIQYRIVKEFGIKSQLFQIPVDQTHFAFVNHTLDMTPQDSDGEFGYVSPHEEHDGVYDDYAIEETDNVQGLFQIEVVYPHYKLSNIDGYNMDCNGPITGGKITP